MEREKLLKKAFSLIELDAQKHLFFFDIWEPVSFNKNELISESGKTEKYFYVAETGVQALYILTLSGEKKIIGFSFDGSMSGVYDSFIKEQPSHFFLEALTPSTLLRITKKDYDQLFELYPEFDRWGRLFHQNILIGRVQREVELLTMSAQERVDLFMKRCPQPLQEIPQKYLASYLNISPETLSRIRASIS